MQRSASGVAPFIEKTLAILGNPALAPAICWSEDGRTVIVSNAAAVTATVLPAYFKRRKTYASFAKELVKYGFRKVAAVAGDPREHYEHEVVVRGADESVLRAVKAARSSKRSKRPPKHASAPRSSHDDALAAHASDSSSSSGSDDDDSVDAAPLLGESRKRARFEGDVITIDAGAAASGGAAPTASHATRSSKSDASSLVVTHTSSSSAPLLQGGSALAAVPPGVAVDARLLSSKARRRSSGSKRKTTRARKSSKSTSTRAPAVARGVDVHDPVAALNELRVFHRRQKEMLSRIVTMESRVEALARDAQVLYASVVAVRDQQTAVHSIISSVLTDGAAAAADMMPIEAVSPVVVAAPAVNPA